MEQLFHYSTINKLALILSSQKIRFNRLDFVNDPLEGATGDFGSMAVYFFTRKRHLSSSGKFRAEASNQESIFSR